MAIAVDEEGRPRALFDAVPGTRCIDLARLEVLVMVSYHTVVFVKQSADSRS